MSGHAVADAGHRVLTDTEADVAAGRAAERAAGGLRPQPEVIRATFPRRSPCVWHRDYAMVCAGKRGDEMQPGSRRST